MGILFCSRNKLFIKEPALAGEIDRRVDQLYGLPAEEIAIIEE
ncbi:MAG TPA: hypothetical protein PKD98_08670 [Anaerolineae bacterium]|nr:hypothetical protein [Anaerolineae bacterium]